MIKKLGVVSYVILSVLLFQSWAAEKLIYSTNKGEVDFVSESLLEHIHAASHELKGILNQETGSFAFAVRIASFNGFNSDLQKEHFNENYLESSQFPNATFQGKLIDKLEFPDNGLLQTRAKGILKIHGVEQEKILKVTLIKKGNEINVKSDFTILLSEFNISRPKIVHDKIAPEIKIKVNATLGIKQK
jgi:YceI-like domain